MADPTAVRDLEAVLRSTDAGRAFGVTVEGFVPKPLGRLLEEKLAAARLLFGDEVDLTSGSVLRKILEMVALEESRAWEHLALGYDDAFVATARGAALSALGSELGLARPHLRATGEVVLSLAEDLPEGSSEAETGIELVRGTRLQTSSTPPVDFFLAEDVRLSNDVKEVGGVRVRAFAPGPLGDVPAGSIDRLHPFDIRSRRVRELSAEVGAALVEIEQETATAGGAEYWGDEDYRDLLLAYPRNLWSADAVRRAVSLLPGVRQVIVKDKYGGLDVDHAIFGNFNFAERLFSEERNLGSPYFVTIVVARDESALPAPDARARAEGQGEDELEQRIADALEDVRPIGVHPHIEFADEVSVGFRCTLAVEGLPVSLSPDATLDPAVTALKQRISNRVRRYVDRLEIHEKVRYSEIFWLLMDDPNVIDCKGLRLSRSRPRLRSAKIASTGRADLRAPEIFGCEEDVELGPREVAVFAADPDSIRIV